MSGAPAGDDSVKVWLNEELVWTSKEHLEPWVLAERFVPVRLREDYDTRLVRPENAP